MKIALVGYGKMGKMVERLAEKGGHSTFVGLSSDADVCIDFSVGRAVKETALAVEIPWVLGTTGWDLAEILPIAEERQIPLLYASNFLVGMALFRKVVKMGHSLLDGYTVSGVERHHTEKKDAPSGTALKLMEEIPDLSFTSVRFGTEVGTHQVYFESPEDTIELTHRAHNREGFAKGALLAAEWLVGRKGIFTFDAMIEESFSCLSQEPSQPS